MVYNLQTQLAISTNNIESEKQRIKVWEEEYKLKIRRARDRIDVSENKKKLIEERLKEKENIKKGNIENTDNFCLGCDKEIKAGAKFCGECGQVAEKVKYRKKREVWDSLPEKEKLRRMDNLSRKLLYGDDAQAHKNEIHSQDASIRKEGEPNYRVLKRPGISSKQRINGESKCQ